jgi:hypothetical protein
MFEHSVNTLGFFSKRENAVDEILDAGEAAAADGLARDDFEEGLNHVEPGS